MNGRQPTCVSCDAALEARDGRFVLKYFLVGPKRRPAARAYVTKLDIESRQGGSLSRPTLPVLHRMEVFQHLRGWAERTRTPKRHFREAVEVLGKFSLVRRTLGDLGTFRPRAATKIVEMTSASSSPLTPARQCALSGHLRHDVMKIDL